MGGKISGDIADTVQVGEHEAGQSIRSVSHDIKDTLIVGEHELGQTGRVFLHEAGQTIRVGEEELGDTARDFIEETGSTIRTAENWIGASIIGIPLIFVGGIVLLWTSKTSQQHAKNIPALAKTVADAEVKTVQAVTHLLEVQPEVIGEIGDIVEDFIPTAGVTKLLS